MMKSNTFVALVSWPKIKVDISHQIIRDPYIFSLRHMLEDKSGFRTCWRCFFIIQKNRKWPKFQLKWSTGKSLRELITFRGDLLTTQSIYPRYGGINLYRGKNRVSFYNTPEDDNKSSIFEKVANDMFKITTNITFETFDVVSEPLYFYPCSENGHSTLVCNESVEKDD